MKKKDIMERILADKDETVSTRNRELDCLIYRNDVEMKNQEFICQKEASWKISKDNVSVEIWEGKAKINVRVSPGTGPSISMKRIAGIIVDAILEELKKEG